MAIYRSRSSRKPTLEDLQKRIDDLEARLGALRNPRYLGQENVVLTPPTASQVLLWDGSRIKYVPTTLVPGTGLPAWATAVPSPTGGLAGTVGTGTTIIRPDHAHPGGAYAFFMSGE